MSNTFIMVDYIANWGSFVLTILNVLWMIEIIIYAFAMHQSDGTPNRQVLSYIFWNSQTDQVISWKIPIAVETVLSVVAPVILQVGQGQVFAVLLADGALLIQAGFLLDHINSTKKYMEGAQHEWYFISQWVALGIISCALIFLFTFTGTRIITSALKG